MNEAKYYPHKTSRMEQASLESEDEQDEANPLSNILKRSTLIEEKRRYSA